MIKFVYVAKLRSDPQAKTLTGFVEAVNINQAAQILKRKDLVPINISPTKEAIYKEIIRKFFNKTSLGEVATFTRNLSTMIVAGLPLTEALVLLKQQSSTRMTPVLEDILRTVEGGGSLTEALGKHPEVFSKVYVALIKAGESAGVLDRVLQRLADTLEKQKEFQTKLKGAMVYPIIVISGMVGVAMIMMIFVIPKLLGLYKEFGAKLPVPTLVLITVSDFMVKNLPLLIIVFIGLIYGFLAFKKLPAGRKKLDSLQLKLPIIGHLQKLVALTEITRTLGLLVGSGVQIIEALNIVANVTSNVIFEEGIKSAAKQVEKGFPLAKALAQNDNFPLIMPQLISIGEETGKMDEVLNKISHFFEMESEESLKGLTTAIEPLIMILLGVGVGFLIIAVIMPIYNLTSQF